MKTAQPTADFILFDLDGTLVDPAPGITGSVQYALKELDYNVPSARDLHWVIGPPLRQSFAKLMGSEGMVEEAVELYRVAYRNGGIIQAEPYAGIFEALKVLKLQSLFRLQRRSSNTLGSRIISMNSTVPSLMAGLTIRLHLYRISCCLTN